MSKKTDTGSKSNQTSNRSILGITYVAVSYTHLDVYKRQC